MKREFERFPTDRQTDRQTDSQIDRYTNEHTKTRVTAIIVWRQRNFVDSRFLFSTYFFIFFVDRALTIQFFKWVRHPFMGLACWLTSQVIPKNIPKNIPKSIESQLKPKCLPISFSTLFFTKKRIFLLFCIIEVIFIS